MSFEPRFRVAEEYSIFSQFTEDSITLALVEAIKPPHTFLEIGCGDGSENNTRALAVHGWAGMWVDGDPHNIGTARFIADNLGVRTLCSYVTRENAHYVAHSFARRIGFLSIDVDGNDYWLWQALCAGEYGLRPSVVCIEAQIQRPLDEPWIMPYNEKHRWDHKSQDVGASVFSLVALGLELGYTYVSRPSNPHSPNLFFVANEEMDKIKCRKEWVGSETSAS